MTKINDSLTEQIIGSCFKVHKELGPGYNEKIYLNALKTELNGINIKYETEKIFKVCYKDKNIGELRVDFVVENKVIVEIKALTGNIPKVFENQVVSYLQTSRLQVGLLINFGNKSCQVRRIMKSL
jgi:GxxExxY protein